MLFAVLNVLSLAYSLQESLSESFDIISVIHLVDYLLPIGVINASLRAK